MNIICPHCQARSRIADEKVPPGGAWARCPKCQVRFFIRRAAAPPRAEEDIQKAALRQRILNRVRGNSAEAYSSQSPDTGEEPEVTVFPSPALSRGGATLLGLFILALPLLAIGAFFKSASSFRPSPPPAPVRVAPITEEMRLAHLKNDLLWLRGRSINRRRFFYSVNYSGPESRIFKHWQKKLIPSVCPEITRVKIESQKPSLGLSATAACLDPAHGSLTLAISWVNRGALLSFPAYNAREEVELFPAGRP